MLSRLLSRFLLCWETVVEGPPGPSAFFPPSSFHAQVNAEAGSFSLRPPYSFPRSFSNRNYRPLALVPGFDLTFGLLCNLVPYEVVLARFLPEKRLELSRAGYIIPLPLDFSQAFSLYCFL